MSQLPIRFPPTLGVDTPHIATKAGPTRTLIVLVVIVVCAAMYMLPVLHSSLIDFPNAHPGYKLDAIGQSQRLSKAHQAFAALGRAARVSDGDHDALMEKYYRRWRENTDMQTVLMRDLVALTEWLVFESERSR